MTRTAAAALAAAAAAAALGAAACEKPVAVSGSVSVTGERPFVPVSCDHGVKFGLDRDTVVFYAGSADPRPLAVRPADGGLIAFGDLVIGAREHCTLFELGDARLRFDCDADSERHLRGDLEFHCDAP